MRERLLPLSLAFAAGIGAAILIPRLEHALIHRPATPASIASDKTDAQDKKSTLIAMSDERIKGAEIDTAEARSASIARRILVPGTVIPDANRIARVSVKLSGTVAEFRKGTVNAVARDKRIDI